MSAHAREHAEHIARNIDREAFPKVAPEDVPTHPDAVIISQALAAGETIVLTGNMNSVKHDIVNRWIQTRGREHGVRPAQILHVQDALMPRLFNNAKRRLRLCEIAVAAAWPENPNASFDDVEKSLTGMLGAMPGAKLEDTAKRIETAWHSARDRKSIVERVRRQLPHATRASERRHPTYAGRARRQAQEHDAPPTQRSARAAAPASTAAERDRTADTGHSRDD